VATSDDRIHLSTHAGQLSLPARIPVQHGVAKALTECTAAEVADYSSQLLSQALSETRAAIELVDYAGEATAQVEELPAKSRDHQDDADDPFCTSTTRCRQGTAHNPR
jgi:hypothetical protein